jgi:cellulose synthase/poly-beta-1,6-N-acetylglucosamine synthase-like glycosyltransferase
MASLFDFLFFLTILLCLSSYVLYPLTISLIGKIAPVNINKSDIRPSVSIIIAAYNEAVHIEDKIQNTLALNYPGSKLEVLIGSDGSTDATAEIVEKYHSHVKFTNFDTNRGKTAVQNDLVEMAKGDILVFTDAASFLPGDALLKLVRNFADSSVGCVAGRMKFIGTDRNVTTQSQGLYWRYEFSIRKLESRLGSLVGVDGPLYAVRNEYYVPLEHQIISDLMTPLLVLGQGKRVVLESEALVGEEPTDRTTQEFMTRRRITLRGLLGIFSHKDLLNPLKHPLLASQIFFHKVLRWFVGPLVIINFLICLANIDRPFYRWVLLLYGIFFLLAWAGWISQQKGNRSAACFYVPYYFTLVNTAATAGIIDFFRGKQAVTWKPVRN